MVYDALIRRLSSFAPLSREEAAALRELGRDRVRQFVTREDIMREGDSPAVLNLILSGWVCRYKMLEDGRRQILAMLVPGDVCDLHNFVLREMDHSMAALSPATVAQLPHPQMQRVMENYPRIARAMWWHSMTVVAMQREWTLNVGQRSAFERLGNLFCELFMRLQAVGLTRERECDFPITQSDLAEATGLTSVHVNRTLQEMRALGLIQLRNRVLEIPDFDRLATASLFNASYLHLHQEDSAISLPRIEIPEAAAK